MFIIITLSANGAHSRLYDVLVLQHTKSEHEVTLYIGTHFWFSDLER